MCVEAVPVLGVESADFLFNWCDLKILSEDYIRHVPWRIGYHAQDLPLEAFQYFDVEEGSWAPELYSLGQNGFQDNSIGSSLESRKYGRGNPLHWSRDTLYP
jgi:hypothetical protein